MSLNIALDAMGGDAAPKIVVEGANLAIEKGLDCYFHMYGDSALITPLLGAFPLLQSKVTVHHTDQAVPNDMKPSVAIRTLKQASMRLAVQAVASGLCSAVVSAGNTGAYMAFSKILLRTLAGIDRLQLLLKFQLLTVFVLP